MEIKKPGATILAANLIFEFGKLHIHPHQFEPPPEPTRPFVVVATATALPIFRFSNWIDFQ